MGVGVYESDFDGTGGTFLIDGPLGREEDYKAYADEVGEDAQSYEQWAQDEYNHFNVCLIEAVEEAARKLGFAVNDRRGFCANRAEFDDEFVGIASGEMVAVGWRSWETDFVIGVGAARGWKDWLSDPDYYAEEIAENHGRAPERVAEDYAAIASSVEEYVRLSLMQDGFECRFKTSGYTSHAYELPEDVEARLEALEAKIKGLEARLKRGADEALKTADRAERVALLKCLCAINEGDDLGSDRAKIATLVPVYDTRKDEVHLYSPYQDGPVVSVTPTDDLRGFLRFLEAFDGLIAVPRFPETEAWFADLQAEQVCRSLAVVVPAAEYVEASGANFVVINDEKETVLLEAYGTEADLSGPRF